ncbi:MAG: SDR family oxidoreductase [Proteobacteria bacterium]|nr:SDR family oxidoreductase [Pseudomonadota bacterium]
MDLQLEGKSVLITGASQGIGRATAIAFAEAGCHLCLTARNAEALASVAKDARQRRKVEVELYPIDLTSPGAVAAIADRCGEVDILVNNAGAIPSGPLDSIDEAEWRAGWELKVFGYINMTRAFLPRMKARRSGVIVNDIGNSGQHYDSRYVAGSSGNAGLMAFTRAIGGSSLDYGVRVLAVNPGPVATQRMVKIMKRRALDLWGDEARWEELHAKYPGGRAATPEEVADLIVFLASPRASYITGTIVTIDGGISSRDSII